MAYIYTAEQFCAKLKDIANNYKTLYVRGCIGAPMTAVNKQRYIQHHKWNATADRVRKITDATADTFGFDCIGLIKSLAWGWCGDKKKAYGGAVYRSNGVEDWTDEQIIANCKDVSTDFTNIEPGEALWQKGHMGVYVGDGLAVECTPSWDDKVQITAVNRTIKGYHTRTWTKHGKLDWIQYPAKKIEVNPGDLVMFNGNTHYISANGTNPLKCKPGPAKVFQIYKPESSRHPYALIRVLGGGSTVYGWVDEGTFTKT